MCENEKKETETQARHGIEKQSHIEDSLQKLTVKVLPSGILSRVMTQDKVERCSSCESDQDKVEMRERQVVVRGRHQRIIVCAVFLLCLAGALQGILVNGLINVVISTIEKRFGIQSTETGFIANSYDIASFLFLLPVSYLGGRGSGAKPIWIGAGIGVMGLGSLLFSLPHFSADSFTGDDQVVSLCNAAPRNATSCPQSSSASGSDNSKFVFMASQFLHGAGAAPLYTLGVTYIDENIGASSSAFFLGIFYTMAIVGPAIGYSLGGHLLSIHTDFLQTITPDHPDWIGAWWLGFVICGACLIIIAWPISLLPATVRDEEPSAEQTCKSRLNSRASSFRASLKSKPSVPDKQVSTDLNELSTANGPLPVGKDLLDAIVILVTNPTFICVSLAGASEGFLMQGLATFLPKMIQNQFNLTASEAAMYVGGVSVVAGGGGTLLGGLAVKKLGLKVKGLLKMTSITQFMAILTAIGLVAKCPPLDTIGPNQNLTELCNCNCDSYDYQPVCSQDGSLQFYNPCYAGCQTKHPHTQGLFLNCSCIPLLADNLGSINLQDNISSVTSATAGKCDSDCVFLPGNHHCIFSSLFHLDVQCSWSASSSPCASPSSPTFQLSQPRFAVWIHQSGVWRWEFR